MKKTKTMMDLQNALEAHGMTSNEVKDAMTMMGKVISTKYMTELYAALPEDVIEQVQTMGRDGATKVVHEEYFAKTGIKATDRLDQIISITVEDIITNPAEYFQKKTK